MFIISIIYSPFHRPRQVKQPFIFLRYDKLHISKTIIACISTIQTTPPPKVLRTFGGGDTLNSRNVMLTCRAPSLSPLTRQH